MRATRHATTGMVASVRTSEGLRLRFFFDEANTSRFSGTHTAFVAINGKIVRRTNALLNFAYGHEFRYSESMRIGAGIGGAIGAAMVSASFAKASSPAFDWSHSATAASMRTKKRCPARSSIA